MQFNKRTAKNIAQLDLLEGLCNTNLSAIDHLDVLEFVYREWFPHRDRERDISFGSFFGKFMRFHPLVEVVEVVSFHQRLYTSCSSLSPSTFHQKSYFGD